MFVGELSLLSNSQQQKEEKTSLLAATSAQVGPIIRKEQTKIPKINSNSINPITFN